MTETPFSPAAEQMTVNLMTMLKAFIGAGLFVAALLFLEGRSGRRW